MTTFTASNSADLVRYAGVASNGDTILLRAGSYSGVMLQNVIKTGNVTITSADPTNHAVLTDLTVRNSQGLTFSNLDMFAKKDMPFQVQNSSRITLDSLDVHGTLNGSSNDDYRGMLVRGSSYVTVSNSHFHELTDALSHTDSRYLNFSGNSFDTIRDNGIAGGGSSVMTISDNTFRDFDHVGPIHPDAIQFWTTGTSAAATDIAITGNVFNRGNGVAIQGIFINDEVGNLGYQHLAIANNVIVGAAYNGIQVQGAVDATLTGNVVIGADDQASWIGVRNVASAQMTDNIVTAISNVNSNVVAGGNVLASSVAVADLSHLAGALSSFTASAAPGLFAMASKSMASAIQPDVDLIGFIDGPSPTGANYSFAVQHLNGTAGADRLAAGAVGTYDLRGLDGNDFLTGGQTSGGNTLAGGKGDDTYTLYQASDAVVENANEGVDTVQSYVSYTLTANVENLRAMSGGLTLHGNALANTLIAAAAGDTLYGEGGDDTVQGVNGNDTLYGNDGNDRLIGNDGNDRLDGGNGNDMLYGGNGNDVMVGGAGNDYFEGGAGLDTMTGGTGADSFVFRPADFLPTMPSGKDVITDFKSSEGDKIDLSLIDANSKTAANDAFSFIGNQAFHGVAGELRYVAETDGITIYGDTNGDKVADLGIHLSGLSSITSSAFVL